MTLSFLLQLSVIMVSVQAAKVNGLFTLLLISLLCEYVGGGERRERGRGGEMEGEELRGRKREEEEKGREKKREKGERRGEQKEF